MWHLIIMRHLIANFAVVFVVIEARLSLGVDRSTSEGAYLGASAVIVVARDLALELIKLGIQQVVHGDPLLLCDASLILYDRCWLSVGS